MFFTADTHFNHGGIVTRCARPFATTAEMDRSLVDGWNSRLTARDDVWHLGDFHVGLEGADLDRLYGRLHGRKRLVRGNLDKASSLRLPWMERPKWMASVWDSYVRLVLSHFALRTWVGSHRGAVHLYGHSHGRLPGDSLSTDVGVDASEYRPVSTDEVMARLATLKARVDPETVR